MTELLKIREAAEQLSISYPTLKKWIQGGKVETVQTPGGHHRIPRAEVERLAARGAKATAPPARQPAANLVISARNQLRGTVTGVRHEGLFAEVTVDVGGQTVTAIIPHAAAVELGLEAGRGVRALFKAVEVMLAPD